MIFIAVLMYIFVLSFELWTRKIVCYDNSTSQRSGYGRLAVIGHEPEKILRNSYWYISPLRDEKTPSFKVNRTMNHWYDFAEGKGGNLVDFGTLYHQCSVSDFLQKLESSGAVICPHQKIYRELSPGRVVT